MREFLSVLVVVLVATCAFVAVMTALRPNPDAWRPGRRGDREESPLDGADPGGSEAMRDPRRREGGSRGARFRIQEPHDGW